MFQLTTDEASALRFQSGTLKRGQHVKYLPYAFTEQGVAMLSSVLRSPQAVQVNIAIMRAFDVARAIRPVLEGHLRQAVPDGFHGMNMLGDMVAAIRGSAPGDPINRFAAVVDELDLINRYARVFHHPPGVQTPMPHIDGEELKGFTRRTLRVVGGF
jgi:hypothetical protein